MGGIRNVLYIIVCQGKYTNEIDNIFHHLRKNAEKISKLKAKPAFTKPRSFKITPGETRRKRLVYEDKGEIMKLTIPNHLVDMTPDQRFKVYSGIEDMKNTYKSMFCAFSAFEISRKDISIVFTAEHKHVRSQRTVHNSHPIKFS